MTAPEAPPPVWRHHGEPARLLYSPAETAVLLGISRAEVYERFAAGELDSLHIGRRRLVPAAAIDAFIAAKLAESADA